jgi:hypothetical protein
MNMGQAILELAPNAQFSIDDNDYDTLMWWSPEIPIPTKEELESKMGELRAERPMKLLRFHRDRLIAETDWWVLPDRTPSSEQLAYRQALRDLPETATPVLDPTNPLGISGVDWPVKPQ